MATRVGVDVGGTFTDLIFYDDETREVRVSKELSTPAAPDEGVTRAVAAAVPPELLGDARYFLHGTTVGLNALLERRGAVVGLLTTHGFRDVLEIRRADRDELYDLFWHQPPPLVPRRLVKPIGERVLADGSIERPVNAEDVAQALAAFRAEGVESIAVAFLNAYANPANELAVEQHLRRLGFEGTISLSHRVSGEYREYERTSTATVDAYVRPRMQAYLDRLKQRLADQGFGGSYLITRSGGGAMSFEEAAERPFETVMSGPVAGANGAAELARRLGLGDVITADVGGTSFDTCLIAGGRPQLMYEGSIVGLPVQTSWVDVRSIGAGGSSVAHIDAGGLLKVGPRSAGADPGPACYGRGGTEPTVTDAAFALGMLADGRLAGDVRLDRARTAAALATIGEQLGMAEDELARGVMTIATASMANAIREITVEQGIDPRDCVLMPFGGAGSMFALLLASELEIRRTVIPPHAGNFSAWGLLGSDLTREVARTRLARVDGEVVATIDEVLAELFGGLAARSSDADAGGDQEVKLDLRYVGQEHALTVAVPVADGRLAADAAELRRRFEEEYERAFGHSMAEEVELVVVRAALRSQLPERSNERIVAQDVGEELSVDGFSFRLGGWTTFRVVERMSLEVGAIVRGPAILREETTTIYLDVDSEATVHESGCLFVSDQEEHR